MNILGISCFYHDSAACLIKNGKIIAAVEEERFTQHKHETNFPINSINYCLSESKITINDIDFISFYEKPLIKFERILTQHIDKFPKSFVAFNKSMPSWITKKLRIQTIIKKLGYKKNIIFIPHHLSHAAAAYLPSNFKESAIFTCDGVGEWTTTTLGVGKNNKIHLIKEIKFPHSLGLLFSTITTYLGFKANNGEGKIMGLASYGDPNRYYEKFKRIIEVKVDGSFTLDMKYFSFDHKMQMFNKNLINLLGPNRNKINKINKRHMDIAASLQKITEEIIFKCLNYLHEITKSNNLCYSGGLALNSVLNGKIKKNTPFKNIFIPPSPSDSGSSMGVALYTYNSILKNKKRIILKDTYLGPEFNNDEVKEILIKNNITFIELKDENLIKTTAKLIFENNIIGWFQGRMEFGPRALGNRSILANPCNPKMKDVINKKVKHRESFRPFAPVVTYEDTKNYFENDYEVKFMEFVFKIKEDKIKRIPAVSHIDGTGRLQTIKREQNPRYYDLIKKFEELSKVPILLNTSFNIKGRPIVCTPLDAYNCMMETKIDYLVLGNYLLSKKDNIRKK